MNSWSAPTSFTFDLVDQLQYRWSSLSLWESTLRMIMVLLGAYLFWQICKYVHSQLSRMIPSYKVWLSHYQGWFELIFWGSFIVLLLSQVWQMHWAFFFLLSGSVVISVGFAFQGVLVNFLAYPLIRGMIRVKLGEEITIVNQTGTLLKRGWTHFILEGSDEKIITIPNRKILTDIVTHSENSNLLYHFVIEFPVSSSYQDRLSELMEVCYEILLLSAYRALDHAPEVSVDLKQGEVWLKCVCYTNGKTYITAYRTFILKEFAEKTNLFLAPHIAESSLPILKKTLTIQPQWTEIEDNEQTEESARAKTQFHQEQPSIFVPDKEPSSIDLTGLSLDELYRMAMSDDEDLVQRALQEIQDLQQKKVVKSASEIIEDMERNENNLDAVSRKMAARERDVNSWLIEEIQALQDIDILYRITMSTNPALADAAMEQIEKFLSIGKTEQKKDESSATVEITDSKISTVAETSSTQEVQKSYTLEEIEALTDMDILYQIAISGTPTEMEAANVAIQKLMSSPPAIEKKETLSRLEDTSESHDEQNEEQNQEQNQDSAPLIEKSHDEEAITLENPKEKIEHPDFEEKKQTRVKETKEMDELIATQEQGTSAFEQPPAQFTEELHTHLEEADQIRDSHQQEDTLTPMIEEITQEKLNSNVEENTQIDPQKQTVLYQTPVMSEREFYIESSAEPSSVQPRIPRGNDLLLHDEKETLYLRNPDTMDLDADVISRTVPEQKKHNDIDDQTNVIQELQGALDAVKLETASLNADSPQVERLTLAIETGVEYLKQDHPALVEAMEVIINLIYHDSAQEES